MAAAAAPARLVSLLPPAARLRHPLPRGSVPLAGFAPLAGSAPPEGFAALAKSAVPAGFVTIDGPGSIGAAARCSVAQCSVAL